LLGHQCFDLGEGFVEALLDVPRRSATLVELDGFPQVPLFLEDFGAEAKTVAFEDGFDAVTVA
jgi:hypothetical protein